jgi:ATP-dependent Clp protease protease subunit
MWSLSGTGEKSSPKYSMSVSMYRGGARGYGRPRTAPPDLPSLLLDARICYLGMPVSYYTISNYDGMFYPFDLSHLDIFHVCLMQIVPAVTELLVAQFMWLDYDNPSKPIYLYINSPGTQVSIGICCF